MAGEGEEEALGFREDDAIQFIFGEDLAARMQDDDGGFDRSLAELQVFRDVFAREVDRCPAMEVAGFKDSGGGRRFKVAETSLLPGAYFVALHPAAIPCLSLNWTPWPRRLPGSAASASRLVGCMPQQVWMHVLGTLRRTGILMASITRMVVIIWMPQKVKRKSTKRKSSHKKSKSKSRGTKRKSKRSYGISSDDSKSSSRSSDNESAGRHTEHSLKKGRLFGSGSNQYLVLILALDQELRIIHQ